jgi:hypothetical protein
MPEAAAETGAELHECSVCGTVGVRERIDSTACPHDGSGTE